jgi:uncharacterized SAM-binding protein YcdF (DUF218 family)
MSFYDAILIPGAGVRSGGILPPWTVSRLERALSLYDGEYIITLSAGTVHRPNPLDEEGFPIFESIAAARWLVVHGASPQRLLCETCSYDTIGNAYFARVIHVEPRRFRRLLVITSQYHALRAEAIFRWVFGMDAPPGGFDLHFEVTPNTGLTGEDLQARLEREKTSLEKLLDTQKNICNLARFHEWLFTEHGAYAVAAPVEKAVGRVLNSY